MATPVTMPQLGESVVEGTILTWLKHEGDAVEVDEPIVEISTEKVDTEIPSPVAGVMSKVLVPEGETVEVGTALCEIDEPGAASGDGARPAPAAKQEEEADAATPTEPEPESEESEEEVEEQPAPRPERPAARAPERPAAEAGPPSRGADRRPGQVLSPLVRRLARENDIDLAEVEGSGAGGRITKQDVLDHVEHRGAAPPASTAARRAPADTPREAPPAREAAPREAAQAREAPATPAAGEGVEVQPLNHVRRRIAEHMTRSLAVSARAWNAVEVDMENIARLRTKVNEEFRRREGSSLTYLPFIARAVVDALAAEPPVNATVDADVTEVTYHRYVNLGIAVAVEYGLIVPVIKNAESLSVVGLARAIKELAERARTKKLAPDEVTGSTFTITNPGPFGSFMSVPIINQPNVAILSTEAVEKRVVVQEDAIAIRHRTFLCMSWDHRLLDGSDAMRFLARLKQNLETWDFSREVVLP